MSPGVGKTYAMLQSAHVQAREGRDVVVGIVETHGRAETAALLEGIEILPPAELTHRGASFKEFDIDGMLARSPDLALVDEMAHSNVPGGRHPKRYQDILDLLDQGIDVYTTMNVQHLESRADDVESLSGARIRERVPDTMLELADEIELIDLSPESLRRRLEDGKVYHADKAATAADAFFSTRNLVALREMSLRSTAERVNQSLVEILKQERDVQPLPTGERIMVAVGPSPFSEKLIRWTKRYATSLNATWIAVHIERDEPGNSSESARHLNQNLELARQLGAEIAYSSDFDVTTGLLRTARRELVTQIVVGRSGKSILSRMLNRGSVTDRLIADSEEIAVHVVPSTEGNKSHRGCRALHAVSPSGLSEWIVAAAAPLCLALLTYPIREVTGHWTIALLFLALTVTGGLFLSSFPILLLAILSAACWNFFFVPPQFTFHIFSPQDVLLFFLLLLIAIVMGQLTSRLKRLTITERSRESRSFALFRFLECLNRGGTADETIADALHYAGEISGFPVSIQIAPNSPVGVSSLPNTAEFTEKESGVIKWVMENRASAGAGTENLPDIPAFYLPVLAAGQTYGVLRVGATHRIIPFGTRLLLDQMGALLGRFLERETLRARVQRIQMLESSQRLQKTLLDTVSHELKTPLTVILSALEQSLSGGIEGRNTTLIEDARHSALRLLRNVNMLLDLARFQSGAVAPKNEMVDLADLANRIADDLADDHGPAARAIQFEIDEVLVRSDETLLFQFCNQLLRNALEHTPAGTAIACRMHMTADGLTIEIRDDGPGLPNSLESLFEPFQKSDDSRSRGLGLGLSIAKRICEALGGSLRVSSHPDSGTRFHTLLPLEEVTSTGPLV
ncbi:MAG: sensor histidine kinase KdpD [Verrucomicrobiae bacterium]|nr:sensor histidine kinase KdpD [Verrucomicrobiae bacterium]